MRRLLALAIILTLGSAGAVEAWEPPEALWDLELGDLKWHGSYGSTTRVSAGVLTLTGVHHDRCDQERLTAAVERWIEERPHARIVPVGGAHGGGFYVWVRDGESFLNELLVAEGICPPRTMMIGKLDGLLVPEEDYTALLNRLGEPEWWKR